jgi:hypothetical protein
MPNRANQTRGIQNGQENLEEVEEAGSNKAFDGWGQALRPVFHGQERVETRDAA